MKFLGYKRPDGKVGIRNHVVVMPGVVCSSVAAKRIADQVKGSTYLYNPNGCGQGIADSALTLEVLSGLLAHPNVYGALIVGLGCETLQEERYLKAIEAKSPGKPIRYITIQKEGGLGRTVTRGVEIVQELMHEAVKVQREECDLSALMLGLECGGSDPTSGTSANVVLGEVSDRLVDLGGTTVISETSEAIGGEDAMRARGATPEIGQAIYDAIKWKDTEFRNRGEDIRDSNPSPGNIRSGLSTLEEKSLGCINKSGTRPFTGCFKYGEPVTVKGATFMETAAYDPISTIGEIAGGCQTVVFTTGMGNPMGCAIAPVIKITGNHQTYEWLTDLLDFDTSANLRGEKTVPQVADELMQLIVDVCNGKQTKAELNGADVIVIDQYCMGC
jgi:altronate dehydratase large subunit